MAPPATNAGRVKAQLAKTRAALASGGIPLPWLDAEILLAHVLRTSRERLHSHPDQKLTVAQRARLRRLTGRRIARVPVPYLIGEREFFGHMFRVTPAVLVPRPSSELLVELAIAWLKMHPDARRVIDLGTGSGAVAISVAKAIPDIRIEARDVSARALRVADQNIARHRLLRRITTVRADLLRGAAPADAILANLPYIPEALRRIRPKELDYEPALALDGGAADRTFIIGSRPGSHTTSRLRCSAASVARYGSQPASRAARMASTRFRAFILVTMLVR